VRTVDIELNLTTETVDQAHPAEPLCVDPTTPVRDVLRLLKERSTPSILVCRDGVLVGIFTERDALRVMAGRSDLDMPVERVMVPKPVTLCADETIAVAVQRMSKGGYRRLPIVDRQGKPTGVVQVSGIVHYLVEHFPKTVYNLPPVAHQAMQQREGP